MMPVVVMVLGGPGDSVVWWSETRKTKALERDSEMSER